jgi:hypothetical protein
VRFASIQGRTSAVKAAILMLATVSTLLLPACATRDPKEAAAREWQRSECNRVVDKDDREKCLKRVDDR